MFRLAVILSVFMVLPGIAAAQSGERTDYFSRDISAENADTGTAESNIGGLEIDNKTVHGNISRVDASPKIKFRDDYEYIDAGNGPEKYMISVDIGELLWSGRREEGEDGTVSTIMIGLKRPFYRIFGAPFIAGKLDLSLAGSLFGIENRGFITLSYDVRTERRLQQFSSKIAFEQISFVIYIPLGKKQ